MEELASVIGIPITLLVAVRQGGLSAEQGSWVHPRVAITESGLCALTLKSRKPEAKRFRKLITS